MKNLKKILLLCTIFFCLCLLAGCSSGTRTPAATEAPGASPEPTATPAPISFEAAAEAARTELRTFSALSEIAEAMQEPRTEAPETTVSALRCAQIAGDLTESDALRVDGEYIYALSDKDLTIFRLSGEAGELVSTTRVGTAWSSSSDETGAFTGSEKTPLALFLRASRLAVVTDVYGYESRGGDMVYSEYVGVDIYDVSDPGAPVLLSSAGQDGVFAGAWLSGSALCVAAEYSVFPSPEDGKADDLIPCVHTGADSRALDVSEIYALPTGGSDGCTVLSVYSFDNASQINTIAVYGADMAKSYTLAGSLFLTETRTVTAESRRMSDSAGAFMEYAELVCTDLFRFDYDISGIRPAASGVVNGILPEKNAVASYDGGFVCLTEQSAGYRKTYESGDDAAVQSVPGRMLYTLDTALSVTAKLSELPDGSGIAWAGFTPESVLLSGETGSYIADLSVPGTITALPGGDAVAADALLPWISGGYAAFRSETAGQMTLALYDAALRKTAEHTFGSDHSGTLESLQSYITLPSRNLLGFSADDSYCLYAEQNGEIVFCQNLFLNDWAWNARAFEQNGLLCIADRKEVLVLRPDTLETAASFSF